MTRKHHTPETNAGTEPKETPAATGEQKQAEETVAPAAPELEEAEEEEEEDLTTRMEEEIAALKDKHLRLYSEFDNYRKRTLKEKAELSKTAAEAVIQSLLPVVDDFERAIRAFEDAGDANDTFRQGITLIYNKLMNILSQHGVEPIKTSGEPFDTDIMEAITTIDVDDPEMKGKVVDETLKGYKLNGKVIRFAKVVVGK